MSASSAGFLPFEEIPGLNPLARMFVAGEASALPLLAAPARLDTLLPHVERVLSRFGKRAVPPGDPGLADFVTGKVAAVLTGQQTGVLTGPLLTTVKALAAMGAAGDLAKESLPVQPLFWCAAEDHDLEEVTRIWIPGAGGSHDMGPDAVLQRGNRKPVGALPVDVNVTAIQEALLSGSGARSEDALEFLRIGTSGTFLEAFRSGMTWLLGEGRIRFADAARKEDKADLVPLAIRLIEERSTVRQLLERRSEQILSAGFQLQVKTDPRALPLFLLVEGERRLLIEEGTGLRLKGAGDEGPAFSGREAVRHIESGEWLPSFSALTRPVASSVLYPVVATVLGPAEMAYWAQMFPLFDWAGIVAPLIIPRPMVMLVDAAARRLFEKTGLSPSEILHGATNAIRLRGKKSGAVVLTRLETLQAEIERELSELRPALLGIDPNLKKPLETTSQSLAFALGKFREKISESAGRSDQQYAQNVERLISMLLPNGQLAERLLCPLPFLSRFGRAGLMEPLAAQLRWDHAGITVIEI